MTAPHDEPDPLAPIDPDRFMRRIAPWFAPLARYHRFELRGVEHLPREGPALLVGTHSAITYDIFLGMVEITRRLGRVPRGLGDRFWFRHPRVGAWIRELGSVETGPGIAEALLRAGEIVAVAPGGMREAMLPDDDGKPDWRGRHGFVRLWLRTRVPLVLATCPAADEVVTLYRNPLTRLAYERFHQPLPVWRGLGPTLLPRPVRLVLHLSPPLTELDALADGVDAADEDARVSTIHAHLVARMRGFIAQVRDRSE